MSQSFGDRRILSVGLGIAFSAIALWFVVASVDLAQVGRVLERAHLPLVALMAVVVLVQVVIRAGRWSVLLRRERMITPRRLIAPLFVGYLGNTVLPARLGEPMRAVMVSRRDRVGIPESLGIVLLERVVDVAALASLALMAAMAVDAPAWLTQVMLTVTAAGVGGLVMLATVGLAPLLWLADRLGLAARPRVRDAAAGFSASLGGRGRHGTLLTAVVISLGAWLLDAGMWWLGAQALGFDLAFPVAILVGGATTLGTAVPSAPGYIGTFELAAAAVAGALGIEAASGLALAVLVHATVLGTVALGGTISLTSLGVGFGELQRTAGEVTG